jgi:TonB family protein
MSRNILLSLLFVCAASANAAGKSNEELSATLQWHMSLDAAGQITALEAKRKPIEALREKLEPAVRSWKFQPGTVNGTPAATDTLLSVQISLLPSADGKTYSVRFDDVRTGGYVAGSSKPPRFPANEARKLMGNGGFAQLVFEVSYDKSGKVNNVVIASGSTQSKGSLAEYAEKAVREWSYQPEQVAGFGVPGTVIVPICFSVSMNARSARRAAENCRWEEPGTRATAEQGQSLALDSSVHLVSDVIGKTL